MGEYCRRLGVGIDIDDPRTLKGMSLQEKAYEKLMEEKGYRGLSRLTLADWEYLNNFVINELDLSGEGVVAIVFEEFRARELREGFKIFPNCRVALQKLKELGLQIGLISNIRSEHGLQRRTMLKTDNVFNFLK